MTPFPVYKEIESKDGVNSNIFIFFHGVGDNERNFMEFAKKLELPQTRLLAMRGTVDLEPILGPKNAGFAWFLESEWFEGEQGRVIESQSVKETLSSLQNWIKKEILTSFPSERVFLFGYGQGGTIALELGARLAADHTTRAGGIISISGLLTAQSTALEASDNEQKLHYKESNVLITMCEDGQIDKNTLTILSFLGMLDQSDSVYKVPGKVAVAMPSSRQEMAVIMSFISKRLYLRNLGLEAMADRVVQIEKL